MIIDAGRVRTARSDAGDGGEAHVIAVHPGALPGSAWRGLVDDLRPYAATTVLDLMSVPAYRTALAGGPAPSLADIAAPFAPAVEALPAGPLVLTGWSFGGLVAHQLASTVASERDDLHLVLLDTIAPAPDLDPGSIGWPVISTWFAMYLCGKKEIRFDPSGLAATPDSAVGLPVLLTWAIEAGALRPDTSLVGLRKVFDTYVAGLLRNTDIAGAHPLPAGALAIDLITPTGSLLPDSPALGWDHHAADLRRVRCAGDHYSMLTDPAARARIAEVIIAALSTASRGTDVPAAA